MTRKLTLIPKNHPQERVFESYIFNRLSEIDASNFEEHLLICEKCQIVLGQTADYVRLMRAGAAAYIERGNQTASLPKRGLGWNAAAAAIVVLMSMTALLSWRSPSAQPKTVILDAYRGTTSKAPAGPPLDLQIDLKDVPVAAGYRVEVVDAKGRRLWLGVPPVRLTKGLSPGIYWVRLSTPDGEELREYGLTAK